MYNSSPVESCLLHIMHVKQFRWNTLLRALRTKSFGEIPWAQPAHFVPKRLKKSFLQYSFPSREKHFSVRLHLHSQHCTHLMCHALSRTLRRNLSNIGLSQPAQWTIVFGCAPTVTAVVSTTWGSAPDFSLLKERRKSCIAEGCSKSVFANRVETKRWRSFKYIHQFCVCGWTCRGPKWRR